jgi:hypothetical protein
MMLSSLTESRVGLFCGPLHTDNVTHKSQSSASNSPLQLRLAPGPRSWV